MIEHLPGFGGDRAHPAVAEGESTIGPETKEHSGCYPLLVANSGERAYSGSHYYAHSRDYLSEYWTGAYDEYCNI